MPFRTLSTVSCAIAGSLRHRCRFTPLLFALIATAACGDDEPSDFPPTSAPSPRASNPVFPEVERSLLESVCFQDEIVPPDSFRGSLSEFDCSNPGEPFFETFRLRVRESSNVTITATSDFDSFLEIYEVESFTDTELVLVFVDRDDDSAGNLDAQISDVRLREDIEYIVVLSGFDREDVGGYSLDFDVD
ncbi:MAG: hypothetical protein AAF735_06540 [Myxococcota bacterium]